MEGFLVRITKVGDDFREYKFTVVIENREKFEKGELNYASFVSLVKKGVIRNVGIENGKLKGTTGSLDKITYSNNEKQTSMLIVLKELVYGGENGNTCGYTVADTLGNVRNVKSDEVINYCKQYKKSNVKSVVQNMILVEQDDITFLRRYIQDNPSIRVLSKVSNVPIKKDKEEVVHKNIEDYFNKDQIKQLSLGKEHGVNFKLYAKPKLSAEQMEILREALEDKLDISLINTSKMPAELMGQYAFELKMKRDIRKYLGYDYTVAQLVQLSVGYINGVDISKYRDPKISAEEMTQLRVRAEAEIYGERNVAIYKKV